MVGFGFGVGFGRVVIGPFAAWAEDVRAGADPAATSGFAADRAFELKQRFVAEWKARIASTHCVQTFAPDQI
jgi:hypothetical protein